MNYKKKSNSIGKNNFNLGIKKSTDFNKFMIKLMDRDEILKDYVKNDNKPFDNFQKFINNTKREKTKTQEMLDNLKVFIHRNQEILKIYNGRLRVEQYKQKKLNYEI